MRNAKFPRTRTLTSIEGIAITNTVPLTNIDQDEIKAILSEYKLSNCDVAIREPGCTVHGFTKPSRFPALTSYQIDDLIDVVEGNRVYIPCIYVSLSVLFIVTLSALQVLNKASNDTAPTDWYKQATDRCNFHRGTRSPVQSLFSPPVFDVVSYSSPDPVLSSHFIKRVA